MPLRYRLPSDPSVEITMTQIVVLIAIKSVDPNMVWFTNDCGCCLTACTDHGHYLIGEDGDFDFFPPESPEVAA